MNNLNQKKESFAELLQIIETLREKCPWDKKQTMESLRPLSIEEIYELADAVIKKDNDEIKKELGDVIMHIIFYAQLAEEQKLFDISDVLKAICEKLRYRHPHIYGEVTVQNAEEVLKNWEQLKLKEKGRHNRVLEGVPNTLPALVKAYRIQDKARGAGFDWKNKEDVWDKVREEIHEFENEVSASSSERMEEEFGDVLFSLINAARLYNINPENALEKTNQKFIRRFNYIEEKAKESDRKLSDMDLKEMEELWQQAKKKQL